MKYIIILLTCLFMNAAHSQDNATTTIYLIRHAEKADTTKDPDLSEAGKERVNQWLPYFTEKFLLDAIYTTPYKRTQQTAQIIADATGVKLFGYEADKMNIKQLAGTYNGRSVLVVGHSNTIPGYINELMPQKKLKDIPETEFGNLYIITIKDSAASLEIRKL
jgi:2,3-bisphosphoglycerate-dependent phosphoglycerate mutase